MKKIYLLILFFIPFSDFAQTEISGGIFTNTTWALSGSPYTVISDVFVLNDVVLTIEPGVIVQFKPDTGMEVRGTLKAIGNADHYIEFTTAQDPKTQGSWKGIMVIATDDTNETDQVLLEYCKGSYASTFINLDIAYHGPYIFRHCYFSYNNYVNYQGGLPYTSFENCHFDYNTVALSNTQFESVVKDCIFTNNWWALDGISVVTDSFFEHNKDALISAGEVDGCTIINNEFGVKSVYHFTNNTVEGNIVGIDIPSYFNSTYIFKGNTICDNSAANINLATHNDADLSGNCWCSSDLEFIKTTIQDAYDNPALGIVTIDPVRMDCTHSEHPENPLLAGPDQNPFHDVLRIIVKSDKPSEVSLYEMSGRKMMTQQFTSEVLLDTHALSTGIYIYEVSIKGGITKKGKIVKN